MTTKQLAYKLRIEEGSLRRNLKGEWSDMPRRDVTKKHGNGRELYHWEFNWLEVEKYFLDKYDNRI